MSGKLTAAELEVLYTANTTGVDKAQKKVKDGAEQIENNPVTQKVDADTVDALAGMGRVEADAKKLVSERAVLKVDADIDRAEKNLQRAKDKVEDLSIRGEAGFEVTAETKRAEANVARLEQQAERLRKLRTMIDVDADTVKAESALDGVAKTAADAGTKGGADAGENLGDGIVAALLTIPIAGAIVGIGVAAGKALVAGINDGMQQEVGYDRLEALTGINPAAALRLGRQASEAYASGFGESIESNMDVTRTALQFRIIDPETTNRDAKSVIEGLAGIADVLDEDVTRSATAVTTLLKTGMVSSAREAFDILATGQREGANRAEDLLDTFTEYPVVLRRLGLTGSEMLGLINQSLDAGARNSDVAADALKEFQIRATDASTMSAAGFERLGLSAEDMTAKIAGGGQGARDGLQLVLDKLRETEDPVQRNAAAVELFGTKAEDLGEALFAMDLSHAVEELGGVQGAAQKMFDTLADNDASSIENAGRQIEVAIDGIKGALAAGFGQPLEDIANFVSENRGPVMQFMLDLANGALDFGDSMVEGVAAGTEALGAFVAGPLADATEGIAGVLRWCGQNDAADGVQEMVDGMRGFDDATKLSADSIRDLGNGAIADARTKLNEFGDGAVALGFLNDASLRLADSLGQVGVDGEGARVSIAGIDLANLGASESGARLEQQILNAAAAMGEELAAAQASGEGQAELTARYNSSRDALISQIEQMGIGRDAAAALVDEILRTPASATTAFSSNAPEQQGRVQSLADRIVTLPDGSVRIEANTDPARLGIDRVITDYNGHTIRLNVATDSIYTNSLRGGHYGGVVEFMARGGIPDLVPMDRVAAKVPANTWRVVGDRGDVPESFIPWDDSARSWSILRETMRGFGLDPDGLTGGAVRPGGGPSGLSPSSAARAPTPAVIHVYDVNNRLIGTMRGEIAASQAEAAVGLSGGESSR